MRYSKAAPLLVAAVVALNSAHDFPSRACVGVGDQCPERYVERGRCAQGGDAKATDVASALCTAPTAPVGQDSRVANHGGLQLQCGITRESNPFSPLEAIRFLSDSDARPGSGLTLAALWALVDAPVELRQQIVPLVVARLSDELCRDTAIRLLGEIGGPREAALLVPLLRSPDIVLSSFAVQSIAATGDVGELAALRSWMDSGHLYVRDGGYKKHLQEHCDAMQIRLAASLGLNAPK